MTTWPLKISAAARLSGDSVRQWRDVRIGSFEQIIQEPDQKRFSDFLRHHVVPGMLNALKDFK